MKQAALQKMREIRWALLWEMVLLEVGLTPKDVSTKITKEQAARSRGYRLTMLNPDEIVAVKDLNNNVVHLKTPIPAWKGTK